MAMIYPSLQLINKQIPPPTVGETMLLDFLQKNLSNEYEIYFQPFLNGDRPDIVLMRKGGGVLIFEVKDWNLNSYKIDKKKRWYLANSSNDQLIKSPIKQILKYKENLYNLHIENLLELKFKNFKYWKIVSTCLFFSTESQQTIKDKIYSPFDEINLKSSPSIVNSNAISDLKESKRRYKGFLNANVEFMGKDNLNKSFIDSLLYRKWISRKSYLFNEDLYLSFQRQLKPSFHAFEDGKEIKYTKKQEQLIVSNNGDQKIRGIVGSGKTFVLAGRAVNAHKRHNSKVLIITYNISLKNYIKDNISNIRKEFDWSNFEIINYHEHITNEMNNHNIPMNYPINFDQYSSLQKELFFDKYYANVNLFENSKDKIKKYKTILIDEVQDFKREWLIILRKYFLRKNGEFVVFGDSKQDIYDRVSTINKKKELVIPNSPGRWAVLNKSYRLTPTILQFASQYQRKYFVDKHELDDFALKDVQTGLFDKIYYYYFDNYIPNEITKKIIEIIVENNLSSNDTAILTQKVEIVRDIDFNFRKLSKENTKTMAETDEFYRKLSERIKNPKQLKRELEKIRRNKKLHFWMNSGHVKMSTIHSFKGWEIKNLFLIISKSLENDHTFNELIYTGFTRSMENLILFIIQDDGLNSFVSSLKYTNEIKHNLFT